MVLESDYDSLAMTVRIMILMAMTDDKDREDDGDHNCDDDVDDDDDDDDDDCDDEIRCERRLPEADRREQCCRHLLIRNWRAELY